jgi:hypothetical protein
MVSYFPSVWKRKEQDAALRACSNYGWEELESVASFSGETLDGICPMVHGDSSLEENSTGRGFA